MTIQYRCKLLCISAIQLCLLKNYRTVVKKERKVCSLIETHSDHFVTRLRRRIAEQAIYSKYIDIIFVEHFDSGSSYTSITVTPNGRFEGDLPPGFCDSQDEDFRAIIKARKNEIRCSD